MDRSGESAEAGLGQREKCGCLRDAARNAEHGAEKVVQVAQAIGLGRLLGVAADGAVRGVPVLMRERRLLRKEYGENEDDAREAGQHARDSNYLARHSSSPARKMSLGSFLPMKTSTDSFFSALVQGLPMSPPIIMCTPWKMTRRGLPFIQRMPL